MGSMINSSSTEDNSKKELGQTTQNGRAQGMDEEANEQLTVDKVWGK